MDSPRIIRLPSVPTQRTDELLEEMCAAIDLVASGAVRRIVLAAFPGTEAVAASGLAHAQAARVRFAMSRDIGGVTVSIGPREE